MKLPETKDTDILPDVMADMEEVCRQAEMGVVRDAELLKRIYERSAKVREDALHRFGVQDIGVPIIREMRERT